MTRSRDWSTELPDSEHMKFLRTRNITQYYEALCRMGEARTLAYVRKERMEKYGF